MAITFQITFVEVVSLQKLLFLKNIHTATTRSQQKVIFRLHVQ